MRYLIDHDFHIHSCLSTCSRDPLQTPEAILDYAKREGLTKICITDHVWDRAVPGASSWYEPQNFEHITASLPLPKDEKVTFLFGCETDLDFRGTLGLSRERFDQLDFIIIPTTHFHMKSLVLAPEEAESAKTRAKAWVKRLDEVLSMDLPFHKVGLAHLICPLIARGEREIYLETLSLIPDFDLERLFTKAAALGVGIELNAHDFRFSGTETEICLRPFSIAKGCGCKFYLGSDSHTVASFEKVRVDFERAITLLGLKETDKFRL